MVSTLFAFFLTCSLEANPSCVPLGEMLDICALDTAKPPQRKSQNDYVDLVRCSSHEAADGVGWTQRALDRTMSAVGKILIGPVNWKVISENDGQSDRVDVANGVFLLKADTPVVSLLKKS